LTLGELLRQFLPAYLQRYPRTPAGVLRVLNRLAACRTQALGGHVLACSHCGEITYHYHSCGDRHCPSCGGTKRASWLARQERDLLPVPYFHVVFTLPHELSAVQLGNRKILYDLLFTATQETLLTIGADPKHLGARLGALLVLHTWGQQLEHHPHIHALVPGGGLSPDGTTWVSSPPDFLVSVEVLGRLFRGKYLAALRALYEAGELRFAGSTEALQEKSAFRAWLGGLYAKEWVVYAKKPFAGPEVLLKYLTRYTHRVAVSNGRLLATDGEHVTLAYKDYADGCRHKEMTLAGVELLRRFALHILPKGFVRVRQCGLLAHRGRSKRLALCRRLLGVAPSAGSLPNDEATPSRDRQGAVSPGVSSIPTALTNPAPRDNEPTPGANPADAATHSRIRPELALVVLLLLTMALSNKALGWLLACLLTAPPARRCPSCGQGELQTIWERPRPRAASRKSAEPWNTS
jgi:hypothetical protein